MHVFLFGYETPTRFLGIQARQTFFDNVEQHTDSESDSEPLPPPPPLPVGAGLEPPLKSRPYALPSPMQLFSSVTTVHVDPGRDSHEIAEENSSQTVDEYEGQREANDSNKQVEVPQETHRLVMATTVSQDSIKSCSENAFRFPV